MTIGTVLAGRYVIEEIVGSGGMAVVYRAWDRKKKRIVAIKVLRAEYERDSEFLRRFSREAAAASKVSHENIVNMYDVGNDGDTRYIVMEYVDGVTLKDMIREMGHLKSDAVVRMGIRILAAVDHAHKSGIVHRDIKPQNILVNKEGQVKVADFGIARMKSQETTRVDDVNASALGSVHYISPEQASGEVADEKSDLYSVGVVLYEMLTGRVPFDGETAVSVALKHVSEEAVSMRTYDPSISKALDEVVMRALRKNAAERYQSAAEMAMDLRKALNNPGGGFVKNLKGAGRRENQGGDAKPADVRLRRARRRRRLKYAFTGVCIALTVLVITICIWRIGMVRVTDVAGMSEADAYAALSAKFDVLVRHEYNSFVAEGMVIAQDPEAGEYGRQGSDVVITVSDGAGIVTIDDYSGMNYDEAMNALIARGVNDVIIEYVLDDSEVGTVVSQQPGAGEISRDDSVVLNVSGETVLVPPVLSYNIDNARAMIENEGLTVGNVSSAYSADAAAGTVIAQSVQPNSPALAGSAIDLVIAQPQEVMFYPDSEFRVVVPLDSTDVEVDVITPTGIVVQAYSGELDRGTHSIPLSSAESGEHLVSVYLDGSLLEEMKLMFK